MLPLLQALCTPQTLELNLGSLVHWYSVQDPDVVYAIPPIFAYLGILSLLFSIPLLPYIKKKFLLLVLI
jgi:hypothetical protein